MSMDLSAVIRPGDNDLYYAEVTIGDVKITIYESPVRPGGVTIGIDTEQPAMLAVSLNDWDLMPGSPSAV